MSERRSTMKVSDCERPRRVEEQWHYTCLVYHLAGRWRPSAFGLNGTWLSQRERLAVLGDPDNVVQESLHHDRGHKRDLREGVASRDRHEHIRLPASLMVLTRW